MLHDEHFLCLWLMPISVHGHCLSPSESLLSTAKDKLIMGKHLLRQLVLKSMNTELALQENDEDEGERFGQCAFYTTNKL